MCEERSQVTEGLLSVGGDDERVASSSHGGPAVTIGWRQSVVLLPPQRLHAQSTDESAAQTAVLSIHVFTETTCTQQGEGKKKKNVEYKD